MTSNDLPVPANDNSQLGQEPCTLVIFGATGDLARRKLMKALYHLDSNGQLSTSLAIIGVDRGVMSDAEFRALMTTATQDEKKDALIDDAKWAQFLEKTTYFFCNLKESPSYNDLRAVILAKNGGVLGNRLFYCATPPTLATAIIEGLGSAGLANEDSGWARVIIEKPFGRDSLSAAAINTQVLRVFQEHQVYRIDHYLGKETVQNILVFRFGNALFEPLWNRNHIDYIEITAAETLGVGSRGLYYEESGALRDMVTNHLLQLLALVAMEPPIDFGADAVRDKRTQVWASMQPMTAAQVAEYTVRGQYLRGSIDHLPAMAYQDEPGVSFDSETETYVAAEFHIDNWRWAGVPFYVRTGKRLAKGATEIIVHFKQAPQAMFAGRDHDAQQNSIAFRIHPNEGIAMSFDAKRPGSELAIDNVLMDFAYEDTFNVRIPEAYEALLLDAIQGDATLFTRKDGVEAQWRLIDPILAAWQQNADGMTGYMAGSEGPAEAEALLSRKGHAWRVLGG